MQPQEKVVYPGHGVAIIDALVERVVAGTSTKFIQLRILSNGTTILVPTDRSGHCSAIRQLSSCSEIHAALEELEKPARKIDVFDNTPSGWNKRNKMYQMRLQRGLLIDVATTYRDLMHTASNKELSFGEKQLVSTAEDLIVQEISSANNRCEEEIRHLVRQRVHEPLINMTLQAPSPRTIVV